MEVLGGLCALFGVESEIVWDHFFKPQLAPGSDCIAIGCGDHCHFLRTLGIAVDEWVIHDFRHGHTARPSASKNRPLQ